MQTNAHWAGIYIGLPWATDGFGPHAFNCWGLLWWCNRQHFGRDCPKYADISPRDFKRVAEEMATAEASGDWLKIEQPVDGCAALLSQSIKPHHVGMWVDVDGGRILHACEGRGVLCQSLHSMKADRWNRIEFYIHKSWLP